MARWRWGLSLMCSVAAVCVQAADGSDQPAFGLQAGLVVPSSPDLRITAGSAGVSLGLHETQMLFADHCLRVRLDYLRLPEGNQNSATAADSQSLETKASSLSLGVDYLIPLSKRWAAGIAIQETRWWVASTNTINPSTGGAVTVSGTSHWTRFGFGPVLTYRLTEAFTLEARYLSSRYGQENQRAVTTHCGLLWRF